MHAYACNRHNQFVPLSILWSKHAHLIIVYVNVSLSLYDCTQDVVLYIHVQKYFYLTFIFAEFTMTHIVHEQNVLGSTFTYGVLSRVREDLALYKSGIFHCLVCRAMFKGD